MILLDISEEDNKFRNKIIRDFSFSFILNIEVNIKESLIAVIDLNRVIKLIKFD